MTANGVSPKRYDFVAQLLHWAMAGILFYLMFFSGFHDLSVEQKAAKVELHAGLGALVLVLGVVRYAWRLARPRPEKLTSDWSWQPRVASLVHNGFYVLFLLAPAIGFVLAGLVDYPVRLFGALDVSGWLSDNAELASTLNSVHGLSSDIIMVLWIVHVLAALHHHFVRRNGLIWRMLPVGGK